MPPITWRLGLLAIAAAASQLGAATQAFAWGDVGHKIVCQLAYLELTPAAKAKVDALIALDPKFRTFAASCTWPDMFPAGAAGRALPERAPRRADYRSGQPLPHG